MKNGVSALERALSILEIIGNSGKPLDINQLANLSGIPLSSLYRLLDTFTAMGFLNRDSGNRTYSLGFKLLYLGNQARLQLSLIDTVKPFLEDLTEKTGETTNLVVEDRGEAIYVERVDSPYPLRITHMIGKKAPLHATGVGKCLLAWRSSQEVIRIMEKKGMAKLTPNTITNINDLLQELQRVKKKGYALDCEECEIGIRCVAAPIFMGDQAVAAISVSGPSIRISDEKMEEYSKILCDVAREVTSILKGEAKELGKLITNEQGGLVE